MTDIAELAIPIEADTKAIDAALRRVEAELERLGAGRGIAPITLPPIELPRLPTGELDKAAVAAALAQERLAQAQNRTALSAQQLAVAEQRTIAATANAGAAASRAAAAQVRLAQAQERAARAQGQTASGLSSLTSSMGRLSSVASGLGSAFGAFGIGLGIQAIGSFVASAGQAAQSLERTEATVRAVAGSQQRYNEVLGVARANQALFGGSLEANLQPLQQFLFISNRTGASLAELNKAAQLLSTINPAEGFEGAGVALSEFFAGDVTSIAERFNLPRAALQELAAEGISTQQKLAGLESLLAQQGITAATLSASLTENTRVYNELGVAASQAFTDIGAAAANAAAPLAQFVTGGLQGLSQLLTLSERVAGIGPQIVASAGSYTDYVAQVDAANAALDSSFATAAQNVPKLTEAQFAYAQALMQTGVVAQDALQRTSEFGANIGAVMTSAEPGVAALGQRLAELASQGGGAEEAAFNLALAFNEGGLSAEQLAAQLAFVEQQIRAVNAETELQANTAALAAGYYEYYGGAAQDAAAGAYEAAAASNADAVAKLEEAAAAELTAQRHAELEAAIRDAAAGSGDAEAAASRIAGMFNGVEAPAVVNLINLYRQLAAARAGGTGGGALGNLTGPKGLIKGAGEATSAIRALNKAYNAGPLAPRPAGGGAKAKTKGKGAGGGKSDAQKAAEREQKEAAQKYEKLLDLQEQYHDKAAKAEQTYQEKVAAIIAEYNEKQLEAQRELARESTASRADFYEGLINADLPQDVAQSLSAAYEQAFAEAQQMAQSGNAEMADDFLALKEKQLDYERQYQEKLAAAREKAKKGGKEGKAAEEEIKRLEAIKRLRDQQFATEEAQLRERGGTAAQERDAALAAAEQERQQRLSEAQLTVGEGLVDLERRKADAAKITTDQLQAQLDATRQLAALGGIPTAPAAAPAAPAAATPAPAGTPALAGVPAPGGVVAVADTTVAAKLDATIAALEGLRRALRTAPGYAAGA